MDFNVDLSIDEFQSWIQKRRRSVRFIDRIWCLLSYTKHHPEYLRTVGICWMEDGVSFASNIDSLGTFMDIKKNTINKDFTCYGIKISRDLFRNNELKKMFDKSWVNWKVRSCEKYAFTASTTYNDIIYMRFSEKESCNRAEKMMDHNEKLLEFLKDDLGIYYRALGYSTKFDSKFLFNVCNEWKYLNVHSSKISTVDLLNRLIRLYPSLRPYKAVVHELIQVGANCEGTTTFDEYAIFCSRFGIRYALCRNIRSVSCLVCNCCELQPWFNTNFSFRWHLYARQTLSDEIGIQFHLLQDPFCFALESYHENRPSDIFRSIIYFDPSNDGSYWIESKKNQEVVRLSATTISELLFTILKIPADILYQRCSMESIIPCHNVTYEEFVERRNIQELFPIPMTVFLESYIPLIY